MVNPPNKTTGPKVSAKVIQLRIPAQIVGLRTPTNVVELLQNLRDLLRSRLVFDEMFFTENNVRRITAAKEIEVILHQKTPILVEAEAFDFRAIADNLEPFGGGMLIEIVLETRPDGKKNTIIHANIRRDQPLLHYRVIEQMIGHTLQPGKFELWGVKLLYQEPTDPYGNSKWEYSYQEDDIEERGRFMFNPAGLLSSFTLFGDEK